MSHPDTGSPTIVEEECASRAKFEAALDKAVDGLEIHPPEDLLPGEMRIGDLRRSRLQGDDDHIQMLTLTEVNGVLTWEEGAGAGDFVGTDMSALSGRRGFWRRGLPAAPVGEIIKQYKFEKLAPNQVGQYLQTLDDKFATKTVGDNKPIFGLRKWKETAIEGVGELVPISLPLPNERVLVFIHGTFSNNDHLLGEIAAEPTGLGKEFLHKANTLYKGGIYAFDHATLSVSPLLNALDLARHFAGHTGGMDIITHSRGGLVTRWFLEGFNGAAMLSSGAAGDQKQVRAVLVGSPLAGTGLAAPPRLRAALSLMTNVGRILELTSAGLIPTVPLLSAATGILKVVTSITSLGAKAPLFDAAIAMIPGLAGQSRVGNNTELARLQTRASSVIPSYFFVRSNFEPTDPGWKFWELFRNPNIRIANLGADWVFEGENDLVVDTPSMTELFSSTGSSAAPPIAKSDICDFETSPDVHHTNYFGQAKTISFIGEKLGVL